PLSERPVTRTSPTCTSPRVTVSSPARQCINVDFPEPDGPMIAVNCPPWISTSTPRRAITWASPVPYTFHSPAARTAALGAPACMAHPLNGSLISHLIVGGRDRRHLRERTGIPSGGG